MCLHETILKNCIPKLQNNSYLCIMEIMFMKQKYAVINSSAFKKV